MITPDPRSWGYLIIWEFHVRRGAEAAFERVYGPSGEWVAFFKTAQGYIATELIHDLRDSGRYVTLDFWTSKDAYERFREENLAHYKALDERGEDMTEKETPLGIFERIRH